MPGHKRNELAHRVISNSTRRSRSVRASIVAALAAAGLALVAAGPASADPPQVSHSTPVFIEDVRDPTVNMYWRSCGTSPHGTRRTIVHPVSGRVYVLQCFNGDWITVD